MPQRLKPALVWWVIAAQVGKVSMPVSSVTHALNWILLREVTCNGPRIVSCRRPRFGPQILAVTLRHVIFCHVWFRLDSAVRRIRLPACSLLAAGAGGENGSYQRHNHVADGGASKLEDVLNSPIDMVGVGG